MKIEIEINDIEREIKDVKTIADLINYLEVKTKEIERWKNIDTLKLIITVK
mgnify:CR=1 FL=1